MIVWQMRMRKTGLRMMDRLVPRLGPGIVLTGGRGGVLALHVVLLVCLLLPAAAAAAPPPTGLLTKESPLPATIPFHVRAVDARDFALILTDSEDRPVISGYLRAGTVLRLLVPPGHHRVTIASGAAADWQGRETLFGDGTQTITLPLEFRIEGDRREGHALTLSLQGDDLHIVDRQNRTLCQIADWTLVSRSETTPAGTRLRWLDPQLKTRSRPCD